MYFESISDLLSMAGHGTYVWVSYSVSLVVLTALLVQPLVSYRRQLRRIGRRTQLESAAIK